MRILHRVVLIFGITIAAGIAAKTDALEFKRMDFDGDHIKESQVFYEKGLIARVLADTDRDGYQDTVIYYKDGKRDRAETDFDRDGKTDTWTHYYFTGTPLRVAEDRDRDGRPDYWVYFKNDRIYKWEMDRNQDGRADVKTVYDVDGQAPTLVEQSYDDDFDGVFRRVSGVTVLRREAGLPHSSAEALLR